MADGDPHPSLDAQSGDSGVVYRKPSDGESGYGTPQLGLKLSDIAHNCATPESFAMMSRRRFMQTSSVMATAVAVPLSAKARQPVAVLPVSAPLAGGRTMSIVLAINGQRFDLRVEPRVTLLDALREYLHLTGTKKGCDRGQCGACTVLVDGRRINSCMTLAVMSEGRAITTIEGLAQGDALHPMQAAFVERDALQCGYCTPGQICSAVAVVEEIRRGTASAVTGDVRRGTNPVTREEISERMSGNICRCGAYTNIVDAVGDVLGMSSPTL